MKTWTQCCDEVAKKYGYETGKGYSTDLINEGEVYTLQSFLKEAAELWREEGIKEAVKLAREKETRYFEERAVDNCIKYTEQEIIEKLRLK